MSSTSECSSWIWLGKGSARPGSAIHITLDPKGRQPNFACTHCPISADSAPPTHHKTSQGKGEGKCNTQQNQTEKAPPPGLNTCGCYVEKQTRLARTTGQGGGRQEESFVLDQELCSGLPAIKQKKVPKKTQARGVWVAQSLSDCLWLGS